MPPSQIRPARQLAVTLETGLDSSGPVQRDVMGTGQLSPLSDVRAKMPTLPDGRAGHLQSAARIPPSCAVWPSRGAGGGGGPTGSEHCKRLAFFLCLVSCRGRSRRASVSLAWLGTNGRGAGPSAQNQCLSPGPGTVRLGLAPLSPCKMWNSGPAQGCVCPVSAFCVHTCVPSGVGGHFECTCAPVPACI